MVMNLYDPQLPPVESPADMTQEHIAWAEDQAIDSASRCALLLHDAACTWGARLVVCRLKWGELSAGGAW